MQVALTIAGFDPSNGAGVTADLQVFAAHGLFGVSAITALTVQSTMGVAAVEPVAVGTLRHMLDHLAADLPIAGVKIGMLGSLESVVEVARFVQILRRENAIPVVLDPVLRSSSGVDLLPAEAVSLLRSELLWQATWLTPNWAELSILSEFAVRNAQEARHAVEELGKRYSPLNIVATGGDIEGDAIDLWRSPGGVIEEFRGSRIATPSTHGTGCAFSSAVLARLVLGDLPREAVAHAKTYVRGALMQAPGLGHGSGPLDLLWPLRQ